MMVRHEDTVGCMRVRWGGQWNGWIVEGGMFLFYRREGKKYETKKSVGRLMCMFVVRFLSGTRICIECGKVTGAYERKLGCIRN